MVNMVKPHKIYIWVIFGDVSFKPLNNERCFYNKSSVPWLLGLLFFIFLPPPIFRVSFENSVCTGLFFSLT